MARLKDILKSTESFMWDIFSYLPILILAIFILFAGLLLARLLKRALIKFLYILHLEEASDRIGIESLLLKGGIRYNFVTLIAEIFYWFLIFAIILLTFNVMGMSEAGEIFFRVLFYIPKVLIAVVILIFGVLVSRFIQAITFAYMDNIGIKRAPFISALGQYAILFFVIFIALEQLSISSEVLEIAIQIALAGLAFAFGLAFGLGGRDAAKDILGSIIKPKSRDRK